MFSRIKTIFKSESVKAVGIYTFSNFFTKTISFASLPVFTYLLTQKDFGIISLFSSSISLVMPFISLGLLYSTSTDFFQMEKKQFSSFISTTFPLPLISTVLAITALFIAFPYLEANFSFSPFFIWMIPAIAYCNFLYEQNLILIRNNNQPKKFLWLNIGKSILELGTALMLIALFYMGWEGRVWGIFVACIFTGFFAVYYLSTNDYFSNTLNFSIVKRELVYSIPAIVTQFSIFCLSASDRFFINYYYGEERTGVYSLAATFASIILILCTAILQYLFPRIYFELKNNVRASSEIRRLFKKYVKMIVLGVIAIVVFSIVAYNTIIHPKFITGLNYFFLLAVGNTLWCIAYFFYSFLMYYKAKRKILLVGIATILVSVSFNSFFIRNYGEWGAAVSNICTYSVILTLVFFVSRKYFYKTTNESSI